MAEEIAKAGTDRYEAVLLYCTDGEDAHERALSMRQLSDNVVVVCPGLTQPLRKRLTSLGLRHYTPPLSEGKLRRFLAALLFTAVCSKYLSKIVHIKSSEIVDL